MTSPVRPTRKKKRGVVATVRREGGDPTDWPGDEKYCQIGVPHGQTALVCYSQLKRAGLATLEPGETRRVRIIIEEV